jgi:NADH:ubiquinone oxidoreductase subunit F (NADH-binding)
MAAVGRTDGHLLSDYLVRGGYKALETCTSMTPEDVIKVVTDSGAEPGSRQG